MPRLFQLFLIPLSLCILAVPLSVHAETKVLTAEATYTMGDGETPSFAEAMALQKAKQMALEQAGTYVESYTKTQNYTLTVDEIQTIAGGVLQVEILDKKRELIGDGMRHYVKIKATVTTDKIADLARRVKGEDVAKEYKKLQEEYARVTKELETWKELVAKTPAGPERDKALDQIRKREKAFTSAQEREAALFKHLVSGKGLVDKMHNERAAVDALLRKIIDEGHLVTAGEPTGHMVANASDRTKIRIPITLQLNKVVGFAIEETAKSIGGAVSVDRYERSIRDLRRQAGALFVKMGMDAEVAGYFQARVGALNFAQATAGRRSRAGLR